MATKKAIIMMEAVFLASLAALEPVLCKLRMVSAAARGVGKTRSWLITKCVRRGTAKNMPKKAAEVVQRKRVKISSLGMRPSPMSPIRYMAGMAVTKPVERPPAVVAAAWQVAFSRGPKESPARRARGLRMMNPKMAPQREAPNVQPILSPT